MQPIEALRYGPTLPVSVIMTGSDSTQILNQAVDAARTFQPLSDAQVKALLDRTVVAASEGKCEP